MDLNHFYQRYMFLNSGVWVTIGFLVISLRFVMVNKKTGFNWRSLQKTTTRIGLLHLFLHTLNLNSYYPFLRRLTNLYHYPLSHPKRLTEINTQPFGFFGRVSPEVGSFLWQGTPAEVGRLGGGTQWDSLAGSGQLL